MTDPPLVYLDHAAATPLHPAALRALSEAYRDAPGNPSAVGQPGRHAARVLRRARESIAGAIGIPPDQLIFTSGGTESIGLAVLGSLRDRQGGHVVASAIEHPAVLGSIKLLVQRGFQATLVPPERSGVVDRDRFADAVTDKTVLACLMHVNNELGTIQPVQAVFQAVKARAPRCRTVTDAVQSFTRLPLCPTPWQADFVALSSHKVGGPRGVGALIATTHRPPAMMGGGDQEFGVRPGTENVPGVAGFAAAVQGAQVDGQRLTQHARTLADALARALHRHVPVATINGDTTQCVPHIRSVSVPGLPSEALLRGMEEHGVCVSAGSACHARSQKMSHVLQAIGLDARLGTMRISFSESNTVEDVEAAAVALGLTMEKYSLS